MQFRVLAAKLLCTLPASRGGRHESLQGISAILRGDQGIPLGRGGVGDSKYPSHGSRVERGAPGIRRRSPDAEVRPEAGESLERLDIPM